MLPKEKIHHIYSISKIRKFIDQSLIVRIWLAILSFGISELVMRIKLGAFLESIMYHDRMIQEALLVPVLILGRYQGNIVNEIKEVIELNLTNDPPDPHAIIIDTTIYGETHE